MKDSNEMYQYKQCCDMDEVVSFINEQGLNLMHVKVIPAFNLKYPVGYYVIY